MSFYFHNFCSKIGGYFVTFNDSQTSGSVVKMLVACSQIHWSQVWVPARTWTTDCICLSKCIRHESNAGQTMQPYAHANNAKKVTLPWCVSHSLLLWLQWLVVLAILKKITIFYPGKVVENGWSPPPLWKIPQKKCFFNPSLSEEKKNSYKLQIFTNAFRVCQ